MVLAAGTVEWSVLVFFRVVTVTYSYPPPRRGGGEVMISRYSRRFSSEEVKREEMEGNGRKREKK